MRRRPSSGKRSAGLLFEIDVDVGLVPAGAVQVLHHDTRVAVFDDPFDDGFVFGGAVWELAIDVLGAYISFETAKPTDRAVRNELEITGSHRLGSIELSSAFLELSTSKKNRNTSVAKWRNEEPEPGRYLRRFTTTSSRKLG